MWYNIFKLLTLSMIFAKYNHACFKKHEVSSLSSKLTTLNPHYPHYSMRHLARAKPFLATKILKPKVHLFLHDHLVQRENLTWYNMRKQVS